ncbi:MAG: transglycosylase domain-containing protein, partial [Bifidobacteriaceae bacterium]|nr:transglycosylase domain-containing protein [Bifidobacteriaceae bacterium]
MSSKSFGKKVSRFLGNLTVSTIHLILRLIIITLGAAFLLGLAVFSWAFYHISIPERVEGADAERTSVYWDDGTTLIGTYSGDNRIIIECVDLPKSEVQNESNNLDVKKQNYVANAIVASEDRTFYDNKGIDPMGIARALRNNLLEGTRQGGSTITQQYAERYFLGNALNYQDKIKEGIIALKLSISQDKDVVLCNYMNTIFFGKTSYGIEAAARSYYGVSANELSISQAALIAGIIPSPSKWDPDLSVDSEKWAKERWKRTLDLMLEDGHITKEEYNVATSEFPYTIQGFRKNAETAQANAVNAAALAAQLATGADAEGNPVTAEEIAKAAEDSAKLANIAAYAVEQAAKSDASITQENEKTSWEGFNGYVMAQVKTEIEENERFAK